MAEFQFLSYEDVNRRLDNLINSVDSKVKVKKEYPLGFTAFNLPIEHYSIGNGTKHIVVTGSYHAAEIITTIFVVRLMEELALNPGDVDFKEYTIDFIPVMNPEGYLITTEMQRLYLEQGKTEEEKIALAKDYWRINRQDAINTVNANKVLRNVEASEEQKAEALKVLRSKKGYQALYDGINKEEFLRGYPELRASVMDILKKNNYDIGVCAAWSANGHGVDLSQNAPFNSNIEDYKKGSAYSGAAYSNIRRDVVGPINCPCRDLNNFSFEVENLHMLNFLANLSAKKDQEIVAFLNYHSIMGKIYQRPVKEQAMIDLYHVDYFKTLISNYVGARTFREENAYDIIEGEDPYNYINEYFRLRYGINIQVELSRMGGNPIGPLADPEVLENVTIKPNIRAFRNFVANLDFIKEYADFISFLVKRFNEDRLSKKQEEMQALEVYRIIDAICQNNPSLYIKLREEIKGRRAFNSHVISYLFETIADVVSNKALSDETVDVKKAVLKEQISDFDDAFVVNYRAFMKKFINRVNANRLSKNQEALRKDEIARLVDNICLDYPEIFAKLKGEFSKDIVDPLVVEDLYNSLEIRLENQLQMGNLIR